MRHQPLKVWTQVWREAQELPAQLRDLATMIARRFVDDRLNRVAGSLSFTTTLAVVPLSAVVFAVLSLFPAFQSWLTSTQDFIYGNFVPASGAVVQSYLQQLSGRAGRLTAVGLLFLMLTAVMLMATIEDAFNDIWRATRRRKLLHRFLAYWAILTLGPLLVGLGLSITAQLGVNGSATTGSWWGETLRQLLRWVPFLFEVLMFMLLYTVVPNVDVRWRHAIVGAMVAALMFEVAKRAFATFIIKFSTYEIVYGALAALPVFLIWLYLSWVIILSGAIVVATLPEWRAAGRKQHAPAVS